MHRHLPLRPRRWPGPGAVRAGRAGAAALGAALGACQSYAPEPLELQRHADAFLARTPSSPEVRAFAASLAPVDHPETGAPGTNDAPGSFDPSDGLTLREAELVALVFNPDLRMARLEAGVTRAGAEHAGLWEDPTLGVDLTRILESTDRPWEVFGSVGLTIPISGRLEIEKRRAGAEHAAQLERVARSEWETRMAVRRAWTEWLAAERQLESTRDFVATMDQVLSIVDALEQSGERSRIEVRLFRIERAARLSEVPMRQARLEQSRRSLRQLMGLAPDAALDLRPDGLGADALPPAANDFSPAALERSSPSLRIAAAEYERAERTLELEIREQFPDLQLTPGYGTQDGQRQFTLGLRMPVPILNGNRRAIAESFARREVARANAERQMERLLHAVAEARIAADGAAAQRRMLEASLVPLVDAQYADARQLAQMGEVDTLVVIESLVRQHDAKIRLVEARRDESLAAIELSALAGPPAPPPQPDSTTP